MMLADSGPAAALQAWVNAHPRYAYTVNASERTASGTDLPAMLHIAVDAQKNSEDVHVVRGTGAGSDIHWSGSDTVVVRGPGIAHMIALRMNVRDPRILSPRKNDIRTGVFARVAQCFAAHASDVRSTQTSGTIVLSLHEDRGIACGPEYGDATITTDRITLDAGDGHPLERERLRDGHVLARWIIQGLGVPTK